MESGNKIDYQRLRQLDLLVRNDTASRKQKDEYMGLLFANGSVTQAQYEDYQQGRNTDSILQTALALGAIALFAYVVSKLISD